MPVPSEATVADRTPPEVVSHRLERELADRRRVRRRRHLFAGAAALVVGAAVPVVLLGPVLVVRDIAVVGTGRTSVEAVVRASGLTPDERLVRVDPAAVAGRVEGALPAVARAVVHRSLSGTVTVDVTERVAVATTAFEGKPWLLSADGTRFAPADPAADTGLPTVAAPAGVDTSAALTVLALLPDAVRPSVTATLAADGSLTLAAPRRVTVVWGAPGRDDRERAQAVVALLRQRDRLPDGATLDLSAPGVVTVR